MSKPPSNQDIWKKRFENLLGDSESSRAKIILKRLSDTREQRAIGKLIGNLSAFGKEHFNFFLKGFDSKNLSNESGLYHPEYVYSTIIAQIGYDISVYEHIIQQRFYGEDETLKEADCLALDALQPAIKNKWLPDNTMALCYYQKFPTIRVIPYANVALIGIPYSSQTVQRDLLSIPHEIGHYIYWRGKDSSNSYLHETLAETLGNVKLRLNLLTNQKTNDDNSPHGIVLKEIPGYALNWTEEIFADMYACLVAGELAALAGQDILISNNTTKSLYEDGDGEHPPSIIRPFIYHKMLGQASSIQDWDDKRKKIGDLEEVKGTNRDKNFQLNPEKIKIRTFKHDWQERATLLSENSAISPWLPIDCIVDEVKRILPSQTTSYWSNFKELDLDGFDNLSLETSKCPWNKLEIAQYEPEKEWGVIQLQPNVKEADWIKFWLYYGWTVEGPSGNPRPPGQN